jgi:hypothetical protein
MAMSLSRNELRLALARGYAHPHNKSKPIDIELIEAQLDEVLVAIARAIGPVMDAISQRYEDRDDDRCPPAA